MYGAAANLSQAIFLKQSCDTACNSIGLIPSRVQINGCEDSTDRQFKHILSIPVIKGPIYTKFNSNPMNSPEKNP